MAATWVSNSGVGRRATSIQTISRSCRAAWKTLTTFWSVISAMKGRKIQPSASGSTITASSGDAIWIRQSFG
jgi:subtilase family serine protease